MPSRRAAPTSTPRMTRAKTRSVASSSARSSAAPSDTEGERATTPVSVPKPELQGRVSYAYGAVAKRAPTKIASDLHALGLDAVLQQTLEMDSPAPVESPKSAKSLAAEEHAALERVRSEAPEESDEADEPEEGEESDDPQPKSIPSLSSSKSESTGLRKARADKRYVTRAMNARRTPTPPTSEDLEVWSWAGLLKSLTEPFRFMFLQHSRGRTFFGLVSTLIRFLLGVIVGFSLVAMVMVAIGGGVKSSTAPAIANELSIRAQAFISAQSSRLCASAAKFHQTAAKIADSAPIVAGADSEDLFKLQSEVLRLQSRIASLESVHYEPRNEPMDYETKIRGINAFAPYSGILVDSRLTSPTRKLPDKILAGPLIRWFLGAPRVRAAGPYNALKAWDDSGDCWCASASNGGQAQLALVLPRSIAPSKLVVEHIDSKDTPDPAAAPKDVELWIQVHDQDVRKVAAARARASLGDVDNDTPPSVPSLDDTWIRVLKGTFDTHSAQRSQSFNVPPMVNLADLGIYVRRVAVRVKSTWGTEDRACMYRLKMYGLFEHGLSSYLA